MYKLLDYFSCKNGKVSLHEWMPGFKTTTEETWQNLYKHASYIVQWEQDGKLSIKKFRSRAIAEDLWSDLVYKINPESPKVKENTLLKSRGVNMGMFHQTVPFLALYALWNTKYAVYSKEVFRFYNFGVNYEVVNNYKDALALYDKIEKELWHDTTKQK